MNTPEQRIAADLGMTLSDLERVVRLERARERAGRLAEAVRGLIRHCVTPTGMPDLRKGRTEQQNTAYMHACRVIAEIDAPLSPPLVRLGQGEYERVIGGGS